MPGTTVPPSSIAELLVRADSLAGKSLWELAGLDHSPVPEDQARAKGWVGSLIERRLGATAGSKALPDFPELGVELKTIPVTQAGKPTESTFVCTLELPTIADAEWETSRVREKLSQVLWVPIEAERTVALGARRVGTPFLWRLPPEDEETLRNDWEELASLVGRGQAAQITAHLGVALQVRPKARNAQSRRRAFDEDGAPYAELPRGFYLRSSFTQAIIEQQFGRALRRPELPGRAAARR